MKEIYEGSTESTQKKLTSEFSDASLYMYMYMYVKRLIGEKKKFPSSTRRSLSKIKFSPDIDTKST